MSTATQHDRSIYIEPFNSADFLIIETDDARLELNPPRSRLARAIWRFFGFVWTNKASQR